MSKVSKKPVHLPFPGVPTQIARATRWACQMIGRDYYYRAGVEADMQKARVEAVLKMQAGSP